MAENKDEAKARATTMQVDTALVRELADLLNETGLTEIEVEDGERKLRVSRGFAGTAHYQAPAPSPAALPVSPTGPVAEEAPSSSSEATDDSETIRSPMVGTVYLSGDPGSDPFVKRGNAVKAGDTLLIVEAMKVMNPITAPSDGIVKEILVENAQPIEFDQPLIVLG